MLPWWWTGAIHIASTVDAKRDASCAVAFQLAYMARSRRDVGNADLDFVNMAGERISAGTAEEAPSASTASAEKRAGSAVAMVSASHTIGAKAIAKSVGTHVI